MTKTDGYVAQQWLTYQQRVMSPQSPPIQVIETRRAFYAGAQAFLGIVMTQMEEDHEPTDADLRMMDAIYEELQQFSRDVAAGRR